MQDTVDIRCKNCGKVYHWELPVDIEESMCFECEQVHVLEMI